MEKSELGGYLRKSKILRCDCGHVPEIREVYASDHSDKPFTFKVFGYTVYKTNDGKAYMPGRRCTVCQNVTFTVEEL